MNCPVCVSNATSLSTAKHTASDRAVIWQALITAELKLLNSLCYWTAHANNNIYYLRAEISPPKHWRKVSHTYQFWISNPLSCCLLLLFRKKWVNFMLRNNSTSASAVSIFTFCHYNKEWFFIGHKSRSWMSLIDAWILSCSPRLLFIPEIDPLLSNQSVVMTKSLGLCHLFATCSYFLFFSLHAHIFTGCFFWHGFYLCIESK